MSNRIYLVCTAHASPTENCICLGERGVADALYAVPLGSETRLNRFFSKHEACGIGPDHYALAHQHTPNHDVKGRTVTEEVRERLVGAVLNGKEPH